MEKAEKLTQKDGLDAIDRLIVAATQHGLPLTPRPYHAIAEELGLSGEQIMSRLRAMQNSGIIRRVAAVPNHYKLGFRGNGMSVWDIADADIDEAGRRVGALEFVSHCYRRPRRLPDWPYSLFAMVHGRDRDEVQEKVAQIADLLEERNRGYKILFSTRILKKTGFRLASAEIGGRR